MAAGRFGNGFNRKRWSRTLDSIKAIHQNDNGREKVSNINNKHIPGDLDSLTRKDMVELFRIQLEEHQGFIKEIESLRTQLAKANERVSRLEKILQRYESEQLQPLKLRVKELESDNRFWLDKLNFSKSPIEMEILLKERSKQLRKDQSND
ncbi:hypothetical protein [Alteromonas phage XX1924]|nr:hypothetical protein [Alteromonas phage XX1924]